MKPLIEELVKTPFFRYFKVRWKAVWLAQVEECGQGGLGGCLINSLL